MIKRKYYEYQQRIIFLAIIFLKEILRKFLD